MNSYNSLKNAAYLYALTALSQGIEYFNSSKQYTDEQIAQKLSQIYKPMGTIQTINDLPELVAENLGEVYDIQQAFVTTDDFLEGAGISYGAGTNVAIVQTQENSYKYDALSGLVNLDQYSTTEEMQQAINASIAPIIEQLNLKLTTPSGNQGQLLGFTANNVVGAVNAPSSGNTTILSSNQPSTQEVGGLWLKSY